MIKSQNSFPYFMRPVTQTLFDIPSVSVYILLVNLVIIHFLLQPSLILLLPSLILLDLLHFTLNRPNTYIEFPSRYQGYQDIINIHPILSFSYQLLIRFIETVLLKFLTYVADSTFSDTHFLQNPSSSPNSKPV